MSVRRTAGCRECLVAGGDSLVLYHYIMNNKDFINALSAQSGLTAQTVQKFSTALAQGLADLLDDDTALPVQGFGTFEVKKKMERVMVNPATRQRRLVPPKLVLAFKPSAVLKEKMK